MRVWRLSADKRRLEAAGVLGQAATSHSPATSTSSTSDPNNKNNEDHDDDKKKKSKSKSKINGHTRARDRDREQSHTADKQIRGIINDIAVFERGERGADGLSVVCGVGKEHRLGRWHGHGGAGGIAGARNGGVVFEIPRLSTAPKADTNGVADTDHSSP